MNTFIAIERKLHNFAKKYYVNELIKGTLLFFSLGFLYLIFTLYLEFFLWLQPSSRILLFWIFFLVEFLLLVKFIAIPIFKLLGLKKGISLEFCSSIIGNHFPDVSDKLLNVLQLKENINDSDLLLASIQQKSQELQPIPFVKAINFSANTKYLKYAILPILIFITTLFTGNKHVFTDSLQRVVNYNTAFVPPAPFYFSISNGSLEVVQGKSLTILVTTKGNVVPNEVLIHFDNQQYYLDNPSKGLFSFTFIDVQKPITFYLTANGITSQNFQLVLIKTPQIQNILLDLVYPKYIGRVNETIHNTETILIPEGTTITWRVDTQQTDTVSFFSNNSKIPFFKQFSGLFTLTKCITNPLSYSISSSNIQLQDYEKLSFSIDVIKDEMPSISVETNLDSISRHNTAEFIGQISDDYGISKLRLVYFNQNTPQNTSYLSLPINNTTIQSFFYQFPSGIELKEGINYHFYFEVFDNDAVNGSKKTKSQLFTYRKKSSFEKEEELLNEQRNTLQFLENSSFQQMHQQEFLKGIQQELHSKNSINFNDKKKLQSFLNRQDRFKKKMLQKSLILQENLEEKSSESKFLQEKNKELLKRFEELAKQSKKKNLLDEITKLTEKLNKEQLLQKIKQLAQQNSQQQRSLERILELTKRYYVEQKTYQIANTLHKLSVKQFNLEQQDLTNIKKQQQLQVEFNELKKDFNVLSKDNLNLKLPIALPDVEQEIDAIDVELKKAEENLEMNNIHCAKSNQRKSAKNMQEMSVKLKKAMHDLQGVSIAENIEDLRKILENLVSFSFLQENLMHKFEDINTSHPDFGKHLSKQNSIKTYFEHIDDSLYLLSMRLPKLSTIIQKDIASTHYNLKQSLDNFSENNFQNGLSNQRYVLTATNNLSDYLSNLLNNMQNSLNTKPSKGKNNGFSLPDIIQKQDKLSDKIQQGLQKGSSTSKEGRSKDNGENGTSVKEGQPGKEGASGKNSETKNSFKSIGNGKGDGNDLNGQIYEIYKQQSLLRQELQNAINSSENLFNNGNAKNVIKSMEQLEKDILQYGFTNTNIQKVQQINYQLLKLQKSILEQGEDPNRSSTTNTSEQIKAQQKALLFKKQFYNQTEILNRQSLPLQPSYQKRVTNYFSKEN